MSASDEGPTADPALVLLHGFTGSIDTWLPLRRRLAATRRVIAVDLPGHGRSEPRGGGFAATVAAIASLLDARGVRHADVVGYSLGGRLALALTLERPDLVGRLVLESASTGIGDSDERAARARDDDALADRIERNGIAAFVDEWERLPLFASLRDLPQDDRLALRAHRLACSAPGLASSLRNVGAGRQPWLGDRLGELARPVSLVVGARDAKYRALGEHMAKRIRGSALEIVEGAGHVPHLERPDAFRAALDRRFGPSTEHRFAPQKEDSHVD